jgi:chromosome segregation ATPase
MLRIFLLKNGRVDMNDELIKDKLETHEKRLNDHSDRLDRLEQKEASVDAKIENLCQQLQSLTTTLRWFIGLLMGSFVAFFFYAVQHNILK